MANVVIVNRKGVQMRQSNGRYAPKIVPPAVASSIGPNTTPPSSTSGVVPVDRGAPRVGGQGVVVPAPAPGENRSAPTYRVMK